MDINELRKKRAKLEGDISGAVGQLISTFRDETGFSPHSISIDMVEITKFGDIEPDFVVGMTKVSIDV